MNEQAPQQQPTFLRFSTHGIVPDNRVQMWEGHNAKALIPLDIRTIDERPLQASETNLYLPSVRMASVFGTSQIVERSESFIADNPTGVVAIFFATEGDAFFFHRAGHISLRPGQAIVYDADRPFLRGFNNRFRELVLTIPKQRYREIVGPKGPELPAVFEFGATGNPGEQALARLVKESLARIEGGQMQHVDYSEPRPWGGLEDEAIGLIRNVLGDDLSSEEGLISAAKNHIELNIGDRGLSPGQVAAAVGISERQLSRIFSEAGTTVGRYVLNRRLGFAKNALSTPEQDLLSVGDIGKRFGFASPSHFSRTFRERHGVTPLQWRKEAQKQRLQG
ncbi:helix-turn-helix domain-containing protein [Corynebacterium sp. S7]